MKYNECLEHRPGFTYSSECAECAYDQEVFSTTVLEVEKIRDRIS